MPLNIPTPQPGVDPNRGYAQSPSGPQGASMQPQQSPTSWMDQLQAMLRNATTGLDPARTGLQGMFGQQQPRTTQTTDPGAGYGQSPSGPTAQMPARQPQPQRQPVTYMERGGSPYRGQTYTSPSHPRYAGPTPRDNVTETTDPGRGYSGSPSNPNWQPRKPMSPAFEEPRPTISVTRETRSPITPGPSYPAMVQEARDYARSPSNSNWRPPGG